MLEITSANRFLRQIPLDVEEGRVRKLNLKLLLSENTHIVVVV